MRLRRSKRIVFVAALSAGALVIGCGDDDDDASSNAGDYSGQDAEVAQVVDEFANAGRDGDGATICDEVFSEELAKNVEEQAAQSCASEVEDNLPEGDYELEIDTLDVRGDTATVGVTDQDDNKSVLHFEKVGEDWRIVRVTQG